jgi:hypothetical protein
VPGSSRTPAEKRLRAQQATYIGWARTRNRTARTQPGRDAWRAKLADEVDPDRLMPEPQRAEAVELLVTAHMRKMSALAAEARRRKSNGNGAGT